VPQSEIALPERVFDPDYERHALPPDFFVPRVYG
jgi:hypothetical protein